MRVKFDFDTTAQLGSRQVIVSKDELFVALPMLALQTYAFEVINLEDGNYLIEYRSKTDNDMCLIRDYEASKNEQR